MKDYSQMEIQSTEKAVTETKKDVLKEEPKEEPPQEKAPQEEAPQEEDHKKTIKAIINKKILYCINLKKLMILSY